MPRLGASMVVEISGGSVHSSQSVLAISIESSTAPGVGWLVETWQFVLREGGCRLEFALLSWNKTRRSVLKPCLRPYPRFPRMLAFLWVEMVGLLVLTASSQAEGTHKNRSIRQ